MGQVEVSPNPTGEATVTKPTRFNRGVGFYGVAPSSQGAASANFTDNTGATPNDTIENVPAASGDAGGAATVSAASAVATVASVNTALTAIENDLADLAAKVNTILTVLRDHGLIAT